MELNGDISQQKLAEETGLAPSTIGKLYRNQANRVDMNTLDTLCKYFNVSSLTDLLEYRND